MHADEHRRTLVSDLYPIIRPRFPSLYGGRTRIRVLAHALPRSVAAQPAPAQPPQRSARPHARPVPGSRGNEAADHSDTGSVAEAGEGLPLYVTVDCAMHLTASRYVCVFVTTALPTLSISLHSHSFSVAVVFQPSFNLYVPLGLSVFCLILC